MIAWGIAVLLTLLSIGLMILVKRTVLQRIKLITLKTNNKIDDTVVDMFEIKTKTFFIIIFSIYIGSLSIKTPYKNLIGSAAMAALFLQITIWINYLIGKISESATLKKQDKGTQTAYNGIAIAAKVGLWSILVLLIMNNLGINITALATGLGIGGVAVALSVQKILGDLFASVSILLDKPFVVGDFIVINEYAGNVEHIGIKTTRIRSLTGEQIIFSNTDLLNSRIKNYKRMKERRILFSIGITYDTPYEKIEQITGIIKQVVEGEDSRFGRCHFKEYGASSLNFETVYYIKSADYGEYMDIQHNINMKLFKVFYDKNIEFAYPTSVVYIKR